MHFCTHVNSEKGTAALIRIVSFSSQNVSANDNHMLKSIEEVKKLQEEVSNLRQENIQLKVIRNLPRQRSVTIIISL